MTDEIPLPPEGVADDGAPLDEPIPRGAATADQRGWGPAPTPSSSITPVTVGGVTIPVHKGIAELVRKGLEGMIKVGYHPRPGECWGYAPRRIRPSAGKTQAQMPWSNHAWGLAVDINAPANPMGPTLITDMPKAAVACFTDLGFRWGGTYTRRPDAMHFEYMGTPAQAGAAGPTKPAFGTAAGTSSSTTQGRVIVDVSLPRLTDESSGTHVKALQALLNAKSGTNLVADGSFGAKTEAAVRAWQKATSLDVDGVVGPGTWKALLERP